MNSLGFLETFWRDLRYGARMLRLNPGFAVVAIASLALGIGANTAIFQLIDAVRLRSLPIKNPQELAAVRIASGGRYEPPVNQGAHAEMTNPLWEQVRDHQEAFSRDLRLVQHSRLMLGDRLLQLEHVNGLVVSGDFFKVLGVTPWMGRLLTREERSTWLRIARRGRERIVLAPAFGG